MPATHFIDNERLENTLKSYHHNPLAVWLYKSFDGLLLKDEIKDELRRYKVGTARLMGGSTVWWQVDHLMRVRSARIGKYSSDTGLPCGEPSLLHHELSILEDLTYHPCYFGSHLLAENRYETTVLLFESERSAMVATLMARAIGYGMELLVTPIACSGCDRFDRSMLDRLSTAGAMRVLRGCRVVVVPDNDNHVAWQRKAEGVQGWCETFVVSPLTTQRMFALLQSGELTREQCAEIIMEYYRPALMQTA